MRQILQSVAAKQCRNPVIGKKAKERKKRQQNNAIYGEKAKRETSPVPESENDPASPLVCEKQVLVFAFLI